MSMQRALMAAARAQRTLSVASLLAPRSTSSATHAASPPDAAWCSDFKPNCEQARQREKRQAARNRARMRHAHYGAGSCAARQATDVDAPRRHHLSLRVRCAPFLLSAEPRKHGRADVAPRSRRRRLERAQRSARCTLPPCSRRAPPAAQRMRRGHCTRPRAAASSHPARIHDGGERGNGGVSAGVRRDMIVRESAGSKFETGARDAGSRAYCPHTCLTSAAKQPPPRRGACRSSAYAQRACTARQTRRGALCFLSRSPRLAPPAAAPRPNGPSLQPTTVASFQSARGGRRVTREAHARRRSVVAVRKRTLVAWRRAPTQS
jgi:hypothetical protein